MVRIILCLLFTFWAGGIRAATAQTTGKPPLRVLVLYENGGHHVAFSQTAIEWLNKFGAENQLTIDYVVSTDRITESTLSRYQLFIQLDYPPYGWKKEAADAFVKYQEGGKGGWIGFHHATLLGEFDGYPMWDWFHQFMGGIRFENYIATFATATVRVEDSKHPVMRGLPESFEIQDEEWYTYDRSPRANVHVLAAVDESTYQPDANIKMGDHPVIWTNPKIASRNIYIFMGHRPEHFDNPVYVQLLANAINWTAGKTKTEP